MREVMVVLDDYCAGEKVVGRRDALEIRANVKRNERDFIFADFDIHGGREPVR